MTAPRPTKLAKNLSAYFILYRLCYQIWRNFAILAQFLKILGKFLRVYLVLSIWSHCFTVWNEISTRFGSCSLTGTTRACAATWTLWTTWLRTARDATRRRSTASDAFTELWRIKSGKRFSTTASSLPGWSVGNGFKSFCEGEIGFHSLRWQNTWEV